ncbi:FG-GAP-like repeat-containing protein [Paludisphaera soli]|uniref:FG-GAP-like repeat-containing protein n=1 Tax=Paludisphaera soli TaxID=2712865 RepID=UPI0013EBCD36|nr:FG-GAP-like repeat-containing protein [Paludisphaera soli]
MKNPSRTGPSRWGRVRVMLAIAAVAGIGYLAFVEARYRRERAELAREVERGRFARAEPGLRALLQRRPGDGEVLFNLGLCEEATGRLGDALGHWAAVPAGSGSAGRAAVMRARAALLGHRLSEAEPLMRAAFEDEGPHAVEAFNTVVHLLKIEGRFEEARRVLRATAERYPDPIGVLKELAQVDSVNPYPLDRTREALDRAERAAPGDDRIMLGRANLAVRTGRFDEAARWLDRCERARPGDAAVARSRLNLAVAAQDPAAARRALQGMPPSDVPPGEVLRLRAWFAARAGDDKTEAAALADLVAFDPGDLRAVERLAELRLREGDPDEAARLRARKAELDRARAQYDIILFTFEMTGSRPAQMARFAETLARPLEARLLWKLALARRPGDPEAAEGLKRAEAARPPAAPPGSDLAALLGDLDDARLATADPPAEAGPTIPRFVDDAEAAGLKFAFDSGMSPIRHLPETMSGGVGLLDFDGDGRLDVYCVQGGPFPPPADSQSCADRLFRNKGGGAFEDVTTQAGIAAMPGGYGHGVAVGDYDGDGRPDLFITRWRSYALYRNRGDGTFEDLTARAGLGGDRDWPTSAAFADLDGDGDLDLYVCHYLAWDSDAPEPCYDEKRSAYVYCGPTRFLRRPDHAFRNDRGVFTDVTEEAGFIDPHGQGLGVVICDLDGDGKVDVFVANDQSANFLYRNLGGFKFEEIGEFSGVSTSADGSYQASMGVALGDPDGDGRPDLMVTNFYNEGTTLYANLGGMAFADHSTSSGLIVPSRYMLGFGLALVDVNADGRLDVVSTNGHVDDFSPDEPYRMPTQLLLGAANGRYVDATRQAGPALAVERLGRGLAAGDLDNDGRVDLVLVPQNGPLAFLRNATEGGGRWLILGLEGTASNRDAVGAKVTVRASGRPQTAWRIGGGSYQSANSPALHFGVGDAADVEEVEVAWPSGKVQSFGRLKTDAAYLLREGDAAARPLQGYGPRG